MRTKWITGMAIAVLGTGLFVSSPVWAGAVRPTQPVFVGKVTGIAYGDFFDARYSSDTKQAIGCSMKTSFGQQSITCAATDRNGVTLTCTVVPGDTSFKVIKDAVRNITRLSSLIFEERDGECRRLEVFNSSVLYP